ncbi:septin-5-like isoform X2 [Lineus longissimus]|uniref:septin-5-like isoform X2 n=1 Tax=Lineus longissimus TaxID=88925 RepID=UPI002B4F0457
MFRSSRTDPSHDLEATVFSMDKKERSQKKKRPTSQCITFGEDDDFIGFATLPEQLHRKAVKRGFDFTLMVVGESGLGKSTLINSLFLKDLYSDRIILNAEQKINQTVEMKKSTLEIEEKGVKLRLTIVDTPGFNEALNSDECWKPIEDYIDNQFDQYFKDESGLNRKNIQDNRVHCCLYFIPPYGRGLRQVDIAFLQHLHQKVNIVPIIAKADTLLPHEIRKLKETVMDQIDRHKIKIYEFPDCDSDEDDEFKKQDAELKHSIPFAVIGSNSVVEVNGKRVRGRVYPWGIVEVDNPKHSDFQKLRQFLVSTHMQDLKDVTRDAHYESFRARHITEQMSKQMQKERTKLKRDSQPSFESLTDTDALLAQKDDEIRRMQEMLAKMQERVNVQVQNGLGKL